MPADVYQSTTQIFLDIFDITNDLLLMKDGTASVIITVDAMNFGLLAEEEQDAVMYAYAGLLNSLNYPIQIVIRSQTKDVTAYLGKLKEQEDQAPTRDVQDRIRRYREFVSNLIRERNVLDKKFYVVIPATSIELGILPPSSVIPGKQEFDLSSVEKSVILEKARTVLEPKRDHIIGQFARIGLYARQLTTQEIIQLFYLSYNPEAAEGQQLTDSRSYTTPLVTASVDDGVAQTFNSVAPSPIISQNSAAPQNAEVPLDTTTIPAPPVRVPEPTNQTKNTQPPTQFAETQQNTVPAPEQVAYTTPAPGSDPLLEATPPVATVPEQVASPQPVVDSGFSVQPPENPQSSQPESTSTEPNQLSEEPQPPQESIEASPLEVSAPTIDAYQPPVTEVTPEPHVPQTVEPSQDKAADQPVFQAGVSPLQPKHFFIPPIKKEPEVAPTVESPVAMDTQVTPTQPFVEQPEAQPPVEQSVTLSPETQPVDQPVSLPNAATIEEVPASANTPPPASTPTDTNVSEPVTQASTDNLDAVQAELDKLTQDLPAADPAEDAPLPPLPEIT